MTITRTTTIKTIILNKGTPKIKKEEIKKYFLETINLEDSLFSLLKNDHSYYQRPEPLRHPLAFYYGHTFSFYINKLLAGKFISKRVNPTIESMMAIGVDEMSWDDLQEDNFDWPSIEVLRTYRNQVKDIVLDYIEKTPLTLPINWESPFWPILMGIEHHKIHIETSSVLIRQLSLDYISPSENWAPCPTSSSAPQNTLLPVKGGTLELGKKRDSSTYGWDNEYGTHQEKVKDFKASLFLVSNQEFNEFIKSNGYTDKDYWPREGWDWNQSSRATHPHFWIQKEGQYLLRVLDRELPMPWSWPVEINYYEAKAFCQWKSKKQNKKIRPLSESEWYLIHQNENIKDIEEWEKAPGNINLENWNSPCPVDHFKFKDFYDVIGNVWQWTETPIYPFTGFKVHPLYDDFTVPTYDQDHYLFKGGSWISTGNEASKESRYAFRKHFFQHAGLRYVESPNEVSIKKNIYETDALLSQYCEFHYGDEYFNVPNFPKSCIDHCSKFFHHLPEKKKALDLGCAVGRSSLELGKYFNHVIGLDFSARFIQKAQQLLDHKEIRYTLYSEGELEEFFERKLSDMDLQSIKSKIEYYQADACNLPLKYSNFDFIFAGNLIDRLHSPKSFLHNIHKHLNSKGLLALASPYTWLEEYTPKSEWIGGHKKDGQNLSTLQGLKLELAPHFDLISEPVEIPFIIRETRRKFQHTLSELTIWQKRTY